MLWLALNHKRLRQWCHDCYANGASSKPTTLVATPAQWSSAWISISKPWFELLESIVSYLAHCVYWGFIWFLSNSNPKYFSFKIYNCQIWQLNFRYSEGRSVKIYARAILCHFKWYLSMVDETTTSIINVC